MSQTIVITDTSVLINFLVIDQAALLGRLSNHRFMVTDHVRSEITAHYPQQLQRLEEALTSQVLEEIRVTDLAEVQLFAELTTKGLGVGECSAIAVAVNRQFALAIDDKKAIKKVSSLGYSLAVLGTDSLVVLLIRENVLSVEVADSMKSEWETNHRFRLPFASFAELI
jgi:predicted nucleic acid-binding protein